MRKLTLTGLSGALVAGAAGIGLAESPRVAYPEGFSDTFVLYTTVDRLDRNVVRFMYVSPDTHAQASGGAESPNGTILVMEDHPAELDGNEQPLLDADGRLIPGDEVTNVFVMEKQPGWGDDIAPELRNGDWDYAWYLADGSPRPEANFDGCFTCHADRADNDYTFTYSAFLSERDGE